MGLGSLHAATVQGVPPQFPSLTHDRLLDGCYCIALEDIELPQGRQDLGSAFLFLYIAVTWKNLN